MCLTDVFRRTAEDLGNLDAAFYTYWAPVRPGSKSEVLVRSNHCRTAPAIAHLRVVGDLAFPGFTPTTDGTTATIQTSSSSLDAAVLYWRSTFVTANEIVRARTEGQSTDVGIIRADGTIRVFIPNHTAVFRMGHFDSTTATASPGDLIEAIITVFHSYDDIDDNKHVFLVQLEGLQSPSCVDLANRPAIECMHWASRIDDPNTEILTWKDIRWSTAKIRIIAEISGPGIVNAIGGGSFAVLTHPSTNIEEAQHYWSDTIEVARTITGFRACLDGKPIRSNFLRPDGKMVVYMAANANVRYNFVHFLRHATNFPHSVQAGDLVVVVGTIIHTFDLSLRDKHDFALDVESIGLLLPAGYNPDTNVDA
ncbi:hypothetical protein BV25DRAFT_1836672 [Artomyces pyxidatus]|uniref:Uncharacterized protein n=1 Tax=Artomyces pyxidatus TaxID=48021 RepID=A0ACB8T9V8_9AGAM|nr:hypothetical protein BV25DRAFT_1836672 [Artomyces pyxidatus]